MEKSKLKMKMLVGSKSLRERLLLSTLSSTPIIIKNIHSDDDVNPGLRLHERSLILLFKKILSPDSVIEVDKTGTQLMYRPGVIMGGDFVHDCGQTRSMGYFLEPLLVLGVFGKKPLFITLQGITNDYKDLCVDIFRSTTLNILKRFGVPSEGLELKVERRGVGPNGGGTIHLSVPNPKTLKAVKWMEVGDVKRIRGWTFTEKASTSWESSMSTAVLEILKERYVVNITKDHRDGAKAGKSAGYGISLVAETTEGCYISVHTTVSHRRTEATGKLDVKKLEEKSGEDTGREIASSLIGEIEEGGVVDSTHQGLLFLLCALSQQDVSKVRVGPLSAYGEEMLRSLDDFLGVKFRIITDTTTDTNILITSGCGCGLF